jgi:L-alanine-DL-glutamate epimerase-like enolase superfamily enzyme
MVVASAFDAAVHDAYGKMHQLNCYHTYNPVFLHHDLGHYLGREFRGETLEQYISAEPAPRLPLYHLIGALDPLTAADVKHPVGDGLPETLPEWIRADGLTHLKIKLNGDDLAWDVERVVGVERVTIETQRQRGVSQWCYSLDFNERCADVGYLLEFLHRLRERAPEGFGRIAYIEQPTARDLKADRGNVMHEAAKLRPVVIDESLVDLESLQLAREMGYTGAALKACKGQSQSLLMAAAARKYGMFLCVQDLSCPGASLIHSAGLAAHVPGVSAIESNARQYAPAANRPWEERFPGIFRITDGTMATGCLTEPGLGAVASD